MSFSRQLIAPFVASPLAACLGLLAVLLGFVAAYALYAGASQDPLPAKLGVLAIWMRDKFYLDELYQGTFVRLNDGIAAVAEWVDRWLIAGVGVRGLHGTTEIIGRMVRELQTGNLQTYAFLFALGVALVLLFMLR